MKRMLYVLAALLSAYLIYQQQPSGRQHNPDPVTAPAETSSRTGSVPALNQSSPINSELIERAYRARMSNVQVEMQGTISKVLRDDTEGSRHQRFIVTLPSGLSILVVYNIDLAERINDLRNGEPVTLSGEYEWNVQGGIVHWTHHDPAGRHAPGWIKYHQRFYQ